MAPIAAADPAPLAMSAPPVVAVMATMVMMAPPIAVPAILDRLRLEPVFFAAEFGGVLVQFIENSICARHDAGHDSPGLSYTDKRGGTCNTEHPD